MFGGADNDTYIVDDAGDRQGLFSVKGNDISGIDKVIGSSGDDIFMVGDKNVSLVGANGNDSYGFTNDSDWRIQAASAKFLFCRYFETISS